MRHRQERREYLDRTDHRVDLAPVGRNLFVSRDKQAQSRSARRIRIWMRVVLALVGVGVAAVLLLLGAFYLVPWFRAELQLGEEDDSSLTSGVSSLPEEEVLRFDDLGLPIYPEEDMLFVINSFTPAPEDFSVELAAVASVQVDARIQPALEALTEAARADGLALVFSDGYISYSRQEQRFDAAVEKLMEEKGLSVVMARTEAASTEPEPGENDFQTGLCLRLTGDPATFEESQTYAWLKANMGKYGFVFRYPEDKQNFTGVAADPTVIRYVGAANASAMQQRSLCLEEYISYLNSQ